jgi:hypothetical protein
MAATVPLVISKSDMRLAKLASDPSLADSKCGKPVSWRLTDAHRDKQRFILSAFQLLVPTVKHLIGFHEKRSLIQWQQSRANITSNQSNVYSRLGENQPFFHVFILNS